MANNVEIGTYTGTGAAINIELGFVPEYVKITNITAGNIQHEWFAGMTAGHAIAHNPSTLATITSNGVSPFAGTHEGAKPGFTAGTAVSTNAAVFRYVAMRSTHD